MFLGVFMKKRIFFSRIRFILSFIRVLVCLPFGYLLHSKRDVYIFCERGTDARDNGYHMFKYFVTHYPEKKAYYIITKDSPDRAKVAELGNVINYKSWKHVLYFVAAEKKISTHIMGYAPGDMYYFNKFRNVIKIPGKHIFLQHGVTFNDQPTLHADGASIDLFICGAKPEYAFVSSTFGHPDGVVQYTGLARYDNLHNHETKKQILVMPTWRMYLSGMNREDFCCSEYYLAWNGLLTSPDLSKWLQENSLELFFYPHYEMQKFLDCFDIKDERIIIASFSKCDVQQLLIDSKLLITDYSSVFFDFAYMKKPSVYYQFDKDTFYSQHYKKGYFDYSENGFGDVVQTLDALLHSINESIESGFIPNDRYLQNMSSFFELYDASNCERIYKAIEALK